MNLSLYWNVQLQSRAVVGTTKIIYHNNHKPTTVDGEAPSQPHVVTLASGGINNACVE